MRMRKRIIGKDAQAVAPSAQPWLDVEQIAQVEITSEDPSHPIESALRPGGEPGWQAGGPGEQTIRLLFDQQQQVRHIHLVFQEEQHPRTHEFVLRWSSDGGQSYREIVRQQYTFSPSGTTQEIEDYTVDLHGITTLELQIIPNISGGAAVASLAGWYMVAM
jgi:hypothetical protein